MEDFSTRYSGPKYGVRKKRMENMERRIKKENKIKEDIHKYSWH